MNPTIAFQTNQNVTLEFIPASIGDRILALLLDLLIMGAWGIMGSLLIGKLIGGNIMDSNLTISLYILFIALPLMFYSLLSEMFMNGQSIGKKVMGIRVVRVDGQPTTISDYLLRWLLRLVDVWILSGMVGLVTMAIFSGQRLGDRAAKTAVVKLRAPVKLDDLLPAQNEYLDYEVTFPQALLLSDRDIITIRKVILKTQHYRTFDLLAQTAERVKQVTGIQTDLDDWVFLNTFVQDHTVLAVREGVN